MSTHELIFSNSFSARLRRHAIFWAVFIFIFSVQSFGTPLSGFISKDSLYYLLICDLSFLPCCFLMVYGFLYFLYPHFLYKEKYLLFGIGFTVMLIMGAILNFAAATIYFNFLPGTHLTNGQKFVAGYSFLWSAIGAAGIAIGIKCAKARSLQEKENQELAAQKVLNELRLLQTPLHFNFLCEALETIRKRIRLHPNVAPDLIIRLSDLLRHLLYDSDKKEVPLREEIKAVENFLAIMDRDFQMRCTVRLHGTNPDIKVPPLILFHFFESLYFSEKEVPRIRINTAIISMTGGQFRISLRGHRSRNIERETKETESTGLLSIQYKLSVNGIDFPQSAVRLSKYYDAPSLMQS